jgi:hypothetical protein
VFAQFQRYNVQEPWTDDQHLASTRRYRNICWAGRGERTNELASSTEEGIILEILQ